ncbi:hypothetical protein PybrP1_000244 [[Pythium] brassicae (nom. inval.)]|nr:hypothetical protein PybrP1_000244 [[Pythium] brassicae (nom. inval.)]
MDSTGATARTPRRRTTLWQAAGASTRSESPVAGSRSLDGAQYGALLPTIRLAVDRDGASTKKLPPRHKPHTVTANAASASGGIASSVMKTPRHTYHQRRSLLSALHRGSATQHEEELPIIDAVVGGGGGDSSADDKAAAPSGRGVKIAMYGVLNTVILIPVMISFAQIIFRDPVFQPYMTDLIKLVLVSAAVHQLCFTLTSSLSFAIGQVQDAGLIFLSAMATATVQALREADGAAFTMDEVLATVLFTLAGSTALLGVALVITGKLQIASFVQYLPMPVVGGYLAYIGFYCLEAGLSMMSGKTIKDPADWLQLANGDALLLVAPGVAAGLGIFVLLSRCDHVAVLPGCMLAIVAAFYGVLLVTGVSLEQASAAGWVSPPPDAPRSLADMYAFYDWRRANFAFVGRLAPAWVAMYFVVAFSSSLDVAAIEMALGTPLDHNHELQTVGISNLVSGLTGGFTGSYIFSQTIFTLRGQLDSRLNGVLVFLLEVALVLCPVSVIAYVPKVFFGALQTLIAADLMTEWMWHARHKMLFREFAIVWVTFLAMNALGLDAGIVLGIVVAGFNFIVSYIAVSSVRRVVKRSRVERDLRERALLQTARLAIVTLELDGFIFFGSSVKMMDEVRRHVLVSTAEAAAAHAAALSMHASPLRSFRHSAADDTSSSVPSASLPRVGDTTDARNDSTVDVPDDDDDGLTTLDEHTEFSIANDSPRTLRALRTRFFILDFEKVRGVDATSVRSCFHATKQLLAQHGVVLVFSSVPPHVERLLRAGDVIEDAGGSALVFESVDKALEWCEDELLVDAGVLPLSESVPREGDGGCRMQLLHELLPKHELDTGDGDNDNSDDQLAAVLTKEIGDLYVQPLTKRAGEFVYRAGEPVAGVYFVGFGKVDVFLPTSAHERMGPGFRGRKRILRVCQGGIIGASELILNHRHQFSAEAKGDRTFLFFLSKPKYKAMQLRHPRIAARFQQAMLQSMARSVMESNISDD